MTPSQSSESVLLREFKTKRSLQETAGYEPRSMEAQRKHYFHGKEIYNDPAYCHMMASHEFQYSNTASGARSEPCKRFGDEQANCTWNIVHHFISVRGVGENLNRVEDQRKRR